MRYIPGLISLYKMIEIIATCSMIFKSMQNINPGLAMMFSNL